MFISFKCHFILVSSTIISKQNLCPPQQTINGTLIYSTLFFQSRVMRCEKYFITSHSLLSLTPGSFKRPQFHTGSLHVNSPKARSIISWSSNATNNLCINIVLDKVQLLYVDCKLNPQFTNCWLLQLRAKYQSKTKTYMSWEMIAFHGSIIFMDIIVQLNQEY